MANTLEMTGVLYRKMDMQKITDKLDKRDFVIETVDDQYPQLVKFELVNDRCLVVDRHQVGDRVKVSFNVRGREWKKDDGSTVFFVALQAWRIESLAAASSTTPQTATVQPLATVQEPVAVMNDDSDLPF